jgi:hypothetical protein
MIDLISSEVCPTVIGTFADNVAILPTNEDPERAASNLQHHLSAL